MNKEKYNKISKSDFLKLNEKDLMFITNPGRMGDEDGSTFIIKNGNEFIIYRVDGWMYSDNSEITLEEFSKKFPLWRNMWNKSKEKSNEKYTYIYMGFGNGLSVDNSIYEEFKPYLFNEVKKLKESYNDTGDNPSFYYPSWEPAFIKMCQEKNYIICQLEDNKNK